VFIGVFHFSRVRLTQAILSSNVYLYFKVMFSFTPIFQNRLFLELHIIVKRAYRSPTLHLSVSLDGKSTCHKAATYTQSNNKQNKRTQMPIPWVGFEPMIPMFEEAKTVHALGRAATVIGLILTFSMTSDERFWSIITLRHTFCSHGGDYEKWFRGGRETS
jgi:hypothetical protein